jgi:hypothetical protein
MRILVDENIPLVPVKELRSKGFDVADIRGTSGQGMTDEQIWIKAQEEKRLLITTDKGFSNYREQAHHGILNHTPEKTDSAENASSGHASPSKISSSQVARTDGGHAGFRSKYLEVEGLNDANRTDFT